MREVEPTRAGSPRRRTTGADVRHARWTRSAATAAIMEPIRTGVGGAPRARGGGADGWGGGSARTGRGQTGRRALRALIVPTRCCVESRVTSLGLVYRHENGR